MNILYLLLYLIGDKNTFGDLMKNIKQHSLLFLSAVISIGSYGDEANLRQPVNQNLLSQAESDDQSHITESLPLDQCFVREDEGFLDKLVTKNLKNLLPAMVAIPTVRTDDLSTADEIEKMQRLKDLIDNDVEKFNKNSVNKLVPFEWKKEVDGMPFWVFGYRLGKGEKKIALITHADVVPANSEEAFELKCENRMYQGIKQPFFIGRGALDDKGPTIAMSSTLEALAHDLPPSSFKDLTIIDY